MKLRRIFGKLPVLMLSLVMILAVTVNTTWAFVISQTGTVTNVFAPYDSISGDLIVHKAVEHPFGTDYVIPDTVSFDFEVDLGPFYANTELNTTAGKLTADQKGTLSFSVKPGVPVGIEGIDDGTKVTVREIQKDKDGFTPKDGKDTVEATVSKDGTFVTFTNVYQPSPVKAKNITLTGTKLLEGRSWRAGDVFAFRLEREKDGEWKHLGTRTVVYNANDSAFDRFDFNSLIQSQSFDTAGTYTFRITEVAGNSTFLKYDTSENYVTVIVGDADMDGSLEIQNVTASQNAVAVKNEVSGVYEVGVTFTNVHVGIQPPPTADRNAGIFLLSVAICLIVTLFTVLVRRRKQKR